MNSMPIAYGVQGLEFVMSSMPTAYGLIIEEDTSCIRPFFYTDISIAYIFLYGPCMLFACCAVAGFEIFWKVRALS